MYRTEKRRAVKDEKIIVTNPSVNVGYGKNDIFTVRHSTMSGIYTEDNEYYLYHHEYEVLVGKEAQSATTESSEKVTEIIEQMANQYQIITKMYEGLQSLQTSVDQLSTRLLDIEERITLVEDAVVELDEVVEVILDETLILDETFGEAESFEEESDPFEDFEDEYVVEYESIDEEAEEAEFQADLTKMRLDDVIKAGKFGANLLQSVQQNPNYKADKLSWFDGEEYDPSRDTHTFITNPEKRTCVGMGKFNGKEVFIRGISKCTPDDNFNIVIGQVIATCRMFNVEVPDFLYNIENSEIPVLGDYVYLADGQCGYIMHDQGDSYAVMVGSEGNDRGNIHTYHKSYVVLPK